MNIVLKVFVAPLAGLGANLLDMMSYLSNLLSYSRLLALGLATGIVGSVVNIIAFMAGEAVPGVFGIIVIAIVLVLGHLLNITLNVLGTFINVMRLHLVEFFPKFFLAKGISLNPLTTGAKYSIFSPRISSAEITK
jgi:V/A-type H+-transporting ATPase subunit I